MKVLTVTPSYPRFKGDYHGRFIQDLCCKLAENGIDVEVLAPRSRSCRSYASGFKVRRFPFLPSRVTLLLPRVGVVVVASHFPEAQAILSHEFQASHPLGALPEILLGHYQPQGIAMFRSQRSIIVPIGEEYIIVHQDFER